VDDPLLRSLKDEREMLLARLGRYRHALAQIVELEDQDEVPAEELFMQAVHLAEAALKL
jgi:hypothetical protein